MPLNRTTVARPSASAGISGHRLPQNLMERGSAPEREEIVQYAAQSVIDDDDSFFDRTDFFRRISEAAEHLDGFPVSIVTLSSGYRRVIAPFWQMAIDSGRVRNPRSVASTKAGKTRGALGGSSAKSVKKRRPVSTERFIAAFAAESRAYPHETLSHLYLGAVLRLGEAGGSHGVALRARHLADKERPDGVEILEAIISRHTRNTPGVHRKLLELHHEIMRMASTQLLKDRLEAALNLAPGGEAEYRLIHSAMKDSFIPTPHGRRYDNETGDYHAVYHMKKKGDEFFVLFVDDMIDYNPANPREARRQSLIEKIADGRLYLGVSAVVFCDKTWGERIAIELSDNARAGIASGTEVQTTIAAIQSAMRRIAANPATRRKLDERLKDVQVALFRASRDPSKRDGIAERARHLLGEAEQLASQSEDGGRAQAAGFLRAPQLRMPNFFMAPTQFEISAVMGFGGGFTFPAMIPIMV